MASTKVLRVVSDELSKVLGLDKGRAVAGLAALSTLKGKPLADALLAEAEDIYTTDTISEESVKVLKALGWTGPKEPPAKDDEDENKSNLPLPDVATMDHDDLMEEMEHLGGKVPAKLRKETAATMTKLRALVMQNRPEPEEEKPTKTEKKEKAVKKEAVKKEKVVTKKKIEKKETTKKANADEKEVVVKKGDVQRESVRTALLNTKTGLTIEELMEETGIEHMKVCRNWLSYLKNPKYAGKLGVITITKDDKKRYKGS